MKPIVFKFLLLIIIIFSSCSKNENPECIEHFQGTICLSEGEKLIHPYSFGDILVFYNEKLNSSVSFNCSEQSSSFQTISEFAPNNSGYSGCLGNYYQTEMFATIFNPFIRSHISLFEFAYNPFDTIFSENALCIGVAVPVDSVFSFCGRYFFREDTLFNYPIVEAGYVEAFFDSITIDGKIHQNIYRLVGEGSNLPFETIDRMLYSISEGILEFSTNRGNVWILKETKIILSLTSHHPRPGGASDSKEAEGK